MRHIIKITLGGLLTFLGGALGYCLAKQINQSTTMHLGQAQSWIFIPVNGHPTYRSLDGKYTVNGTIVDNIKSINISEEQMDAFRKSKLVTTKDIPIINFTSLSEKYRVFIFSDIDCSFCRKLHGKREEFARRGISLTYILYPREGINSRSFRKASLVACSANQRKALTDFMEGDAPEVTDTTKGCTEDVANGWKLGNELGVKGTPAIVLPSGRLLNRYMTASQLLAELNADAANTHK